MTEQRSTFSESWHRVQGLRPRLNPAVHSVRQSVRGRRWYFLRDPWTHDSYRLHEAAYQFVGLLNGQRTIDQAWELAQSAMDESALTQPEVIELLAWLHGSNLLQGDIPPDAALVFQRQQKRRRHEVGARFANVMSVRVPLLDPDPWLERWTGLLGAAFSWPGLLAWFALLSAGLMNLAGRSEDLLIEAQSLLSPDPGRLLSMYLSFAGLKIIHEIGHGVACKKFGRMAGDSGAVHSTGVMFLVLAPVPFVDVSSSWLLRNKWHRAAIGAAGMYVELAIAAVAAILWAQTGPGIVHSTCHQLIFWASVSTVLFNANPLLRFDGYYILSDLLEIPNLDQRSRGYVSYLIRRHVFGVQRALTPAHTGGDRFWLPLYFVLAWVYRIFLAIAIVSFIAGKFFTIGLLLAIIVIAGWLVLPLVRVVNYLATSGELERVRLRAALATGVICACVLGLLGLAPAPDWASAEAVAEPVEIALVYPREAGFIEQVAPSGQAVAPGQVLVVLDNDQLLQQKQRAEIDVELVRTQLRTAEARGDADVDRLRRELVVREDKLGWFTERLSRFEIKAPVGGVWLCRNWESLAGRFADPSTAPALGAVASLDSLRLRVAADQALGPRIAAESRVGQHVRVRPRGLPDHEFVGVIERMNPAGQQYLPSAALASDGGGKLSNAEDASDPRQTAEPVFEVWIRPLSDDALPARLLPGQRFQIRFDFPSAPLGRQWLREALRLIQRRFEMKS